MGLISINIFQSKHHALCMRRIINKNLDENCNILGSIQYLTLRINPDILVAIAKFMDSVMVMWVILMRLIKSIDEKWMIRNEKHMIFGNCMPISLKRI